MAYDSTKKVTLAQLATVANKCVEAIGSAIEALPAEQFLDQAKTVFVQSFAFSAASYPNATDPNLNGKPVLVLAVKTVDNKTKAETINYSFLNIADLVKTYSIASDSTKVLTINGTEIAFKISEVANNVLELKNDGLFADVSGKADKKVPATAGNIATLDANGNLADSGVLASTIGNKADKKVPAAAGNIATLDADGNLADSGIAPSTKADKVTNATNGNIAGIDANGQYTDSGVAVTTIANKTDKVSNATNGHIAGLDANGNLTDSGVVAANVATKAASPTAGHVASLDANGNPTDSGIAAANILTTADVATDAEVNEMLTEVFGA